MRLTGQKTSHAVNGQLTVDPTRSARPPSALPWPNPVHKKGEHPTHVQPSHQVIIADRVPPFQASDVAIAMGCGDVKLEAALASTARALPSPVFSRHQPADPDRQVVDSGTLGFGASGTRMASPELRSRVRTRCGRWLLLYGTRLTGGATDRTSVVIQPATSNEVAPIVALAYGLTPRERDVTQLCMAGRSTEQMAQRLGVAAYTAQDHLKSIFDKTGARTRGELVGQIFLEHHIPRWDRAEATPAGWLALTDDLEQ